MLCREWSYPQFLNFIANIQNLLQNPPLVTLSRKYMRAVGSREETQERREQCQTFQKFWGIQGDSSAARMVDLWTLDLLLSKTFPKSENL